MIKIYSFAICYCVIAAVQAQPYIDIASLKYLHSPDAKAYGD